MSKKRKHITIEEDDKKATKDDDTLGEKNNWSPENWEQVLENLREMRKDRSAPCDGDKRKKQNGKVYTEKERRFHCLIGLMMSSQTKDEVTYGACQRLKEHGFTIDNLLNTSDEKLGQLIYPVGFWKTKVKFIKEACQVMKDQYDSDIPNTVEDLCKLKGVGPKMAYLCMSSAWGKVVGIGVDTHVHRIAARLGWTEKEAKTAEATRKGLEAWLPKESWREINMLLVGFGQQICLPVGPKCGDCLNQQICPVGQKWQPKKSTPTKKRTN